MKKPEGLICTSIDTGVSKFITKSFLNNNIPILIMCFILGKLKISKGRKNIYETLLNCVF